MQVSGRQRGKLRYTRPDVPFCTSERSYLRHSVYVGTQLQVDETKEPRHFLAQIKCHDGSRPALKTKQSSIQLESKQNYTQLSTAQAAKLVLADHQEGKLSEKEPLNCVLLILGLSP